MDVLEPKLVRVEGRCYRFYESDAWSAKDHESTPYDDQDSNRREFCELNQDSCPQEMDIVPIEGGRYKYTSCIPKLSYRFLIGPNGSTRKKLEQDTKTTITIPRLGKDGNVEITSSSRTAIISASHRINLLVESSRKKIKPTHFLSIPMREATIAANFDKFKDTVLRETGKNSTGIEEGLFQKPEKMHLTLGMLLLMDDNETKTAMNALEECYKTIMKPIIAEHSPITIRAQGLEYFNDDPSEVSVLYGKVSSANNILQELVEIIVDFFVQKGLMRRENDDNLNLHLTLMNSSFLADKNKPHSPQFRKFDATDVLKVHKDYYFGESVLKTIQLCSRGAKAEDGYYTVVSKVDFND